MYPPFAMKLYRGKARYYEQLAKFWVELVTTPIAASPVDQLVTAECTDADGKPKASEPRSIDAVARGAVKDANDLTM